MLDTPSRPRRALAVAGLVVAVALLVPGLIMPVITIRGVLQPDGIADLAPKLLEQGISDESLATLKPMINPMMLALIEASPGGLRGAIVTRLGPQIAAGLKKGGGSRCISRRAASSDRCGTCTGGQSDGGHADSDLQRARAVHQGVAGDVGQARKDALGRERTLHFVEIIAKWSMADVFAVALIIAYLAAQATQTVGSGPSASLVTFTATFGPGFYWFAAYCVFSLGLQQVTSRWIHGGAPSVGR